MKVQLKNMEGMILEERFLLSIIRGPGRDQLLKAFRDKPELYSVETNVRRYTASDIYAGRLGQTI